MLATNPYVTFFSTSTLVAVIVFAVALFSPAQAHAINGRDAVGVCIDSTASGANCAWGVNGKGEIDICNKSGCVYCASASADCVVANVAPGGRPTRGLPVVRPSAPPSARSKCRQDCIKGRS
jgi:hypothetical protein